MRLACDAPDVDSCVMVEVVVRRNQSIASGILEADWITVVDAVEALDGSND